MTVLLYAEVLALLSNGKDHGIITLAVIIKRRKRRAIRHQIFFPAKIDPSIPHKVLCPYRLPCQTSRYGKMISQKIPIFRMLRSVFIFLSNDTPEPLLLFLREILIAQDSDQPLFLCRQNRLQCIRHVFRLINLNGLTGGHRIRNIQWVATWVQLCHPVNIPRSPLVGFLQHPRVILFDPKNAIRIKSVGPPFFPWPVIGKAILPAIPFHGIAQIDQHIFTLLGKIDQRYAVIGNPRLQDL